MKIVASSFFLQSISNQYLVIIFMDIWKSRHKKYFLTTEACFFVFCYFTWRLEISIENHVKHLEFKEALREIAQRVAHFNSPYDRVRIVEWTRRLAGIRDDSIDEAKNRNDYIQLLKIMTRGGRLHGVFLKCPPESDIPPLAEAMANFLSDQCPDLPRAGPVEPIVSRQTPDGCAYIAFRKIPEKGVLCYMAVSPDGLKFEDSESENEENKTGKERVDQNGTNRL